MVTVHVVAHAQARWYGRYEGESLHAEQAMTSQMKRINVDNDEGRSMSEQSWVEVRERGDHN